VGSWLADIEGLNRQDVINQLFTMAIGISPGALLLGTVADYFGGNRRVDRKIAYELIGAASLGQVSGYLGKSHELALWRPAAGGLGVRRIAKSRPDLLTYWHAHARIVSA
jgi:hypothetical protein